MSRIKLNVAQVSVDPTTGLSTVLLCEVEGRGCLAIGVAKSEAQAISAGLGEVEFIRPLPHDLLKQVLALSGLSFHSCEIYPGLGEGAPHRAEILVQDRDGALHRLEARPADAVALALRTGGEIFISQAAMQGLRPAPGIGFSQRIELSPPALSQRRPKWRM